MTIDVKLPDFLDEETDEEIMQRMLDEIPNDIDKSEGSFIWDALKGPSIELAKTIEGIREGLRRAFTATTFDRYLDIKAAEKGLIRQEAVKAVGRVRFTGKSGTIIPKGTRVATPADNITAAVEFETIEQGMINASQTAEIPIRAIEAGEIGNVFANDISVILPGISGVISVTNDLRTTGGLNTEDDESLRQRIFEENQKDEGSGNIDDYKTWAKEIIGVGTVVVEPLWNGPNTVRVIVFDRSGESASESLINDVQKHLDPKQDGSGEGKAPVGAIVTVTTVAVEMINVTIPGLQLNSNYTLDQVKQMINESLKIFFQQEIDAGSVIRMRSVEAALIKLDGVFDFDDILLNGEKANITLPSTKTAGLGSVTYT